MFENFFKSIPIFDFRLLLKVFVGSTTVLLLCSSYSLSATAVQDSFILDLDIVNWRSRVVPFPFDL